MIILFFKLLVCSRVRQRLIENGTNNIAILPKTFRSSESYDSSLEKISYKCFFSSLEKFGVQLRKEEAVLLLKFFDKDNDEKIYFNDFLYSIRDRPNKERQSVIDLVFYKFDKTKTDSAESTEFRKVFNCVKHPRYLMGDYSENQIFYLFLKNFTNEKNISHVTKKQWDDYYAGVSATIDDDMHFIRLIKNQFKVE